MKENLELNPKLLESFGIVGKREFFLNNLFILMITSPIWLVFMLLMSIPKIADSDSGSVVIGISFIVTIIANTLLLIPSTIKRLNDINGKIDKRFNIIFVLGFVLSILLMFWHGIFFLFVLGAYLFLLFKKGKITGRYPYNIEKDFNWGACFGTWIWGIVNKSYKTLWILPIILTPLAIIYQIICGFKGNEWALKNRKWESMQHFKESQETQTVVFVILNFLIMPIIIYILIFAIVFIFMTKIFAEDIKNPSKMESKLEQFDNTLNKMSSFCFESYELKPEINKFYVYPSAWNGATFNDRKKMLEFAASISASQKKKQQYDKSSYISKEEELKRTIIYNSKNKDEILGKYVEYHKEYSNGKMSLKDAIEETFKSYKFYEVKS